MGHDLTTLQFTAARWAHVLGIATSGHTWRTAYPVLDNDYYLSEAFVCMLLEAALI